MYEGWKIYTYTKKADTSTLMDALKVRFNSGEWYFSANSHRATIFYGSNKEEITVSFENMKYGSEIDRPQEMYHVVLESIFFGLRIGEEKAHQEVCKKVYGKIPWKKKGVWLQDEGEIPIPKRTILRKK